MQRRKKQFHGTHIILAKRVNVKDPNVLDVVKNKQNMNMNFLLKNNSMEKCEHL